MPQRTGSQQRSDSVLIALSISGDTRAFAALYGRWHPRWLGFAKWLVNDAEDARDVMQEASIAIATNIHRLNDPTVFAAWSFTIIRRRAADHIRGTTAVRRLRDALMQVPEPDNTGHSDHSDTADLLQLVGADDRQLLTLFYVYGLSVAEAASALGVPPGTVKSRLFHARARLKNAYTEALPGEKK
ncbi:MAG: sigma-70 family RNA polymerase sigma factor [Pseudomonadota bacterium]